ncbi:MAG: dihydroorotase [Ruminiclostridium sp.]|nr:dihydroorotase [Ruminiclostridium sp.]
MKLLLKKGHVVSSFNRLEDDLDVLIEDNVIVKVAKNIRNKADKVIDCTGLAVIPGLCDMHVHFRDPGQTHKEDIITGSEAAAAGGVTAVACMPNTSPVCDNPETIRYIIEKAKNAKIKVYPIGSITKGLQGEELCDFKALKAAGAVAVSDDGKPVKNARIMGRAMIDAHYAGLRVISHCEDLDIIRGGIVNAGVISVELGVRGMSRTSENIITAREIQLANDLEVPIHIAHVSTKEVVDLLRFATGRGVMVTSETAPHYFTLTEDRLLTRDADYRMNPPLRTEEDVKAISSAVMDGTIDCIVTDHAPHTAEEKADFMTAPNGVVGMETSLAATLTKFYHTGKMPLMKIVRMMCETPRVILGIEGGTIEQGAVADIAIVDLNKEWIVEPEKLHSKSHNTCFKGMMFKGKTKYTIVNGNVVYEDE